MSVRNGVNFFARLACTTIVLFAVATNSYAVVSGYTNFEQTFGYKADQPPKSYHVECIGASSPGNVFWPGDEARIDFQIVNKTDQPLKATGKWELIQYATRTKPTDSFAPAVVSKLKDVGSVPANVDIAPNGFANVNVALPLPAEFGAYAVVLSLDGQGRELAAICVRCVEAVPGKHQFPAFACDIQTPALAPLFQRIGIKGTRIECGRFNIDDKSQWDRLDEQMKAMHDANIAVMVTVATGGDTSKMPLGRIRGFLNDKAQGKMDYPGDFTILPQHDQEFQDWTRMVIERYGWPKGPVNAIELWNEPWEGISISGWGADMPRYRDLYTRMAIATEEGCKNAGVHVLIGGACSSMNTEDKLFPDGKDDPFLKWLDFTSIHYQPMCAEPVLIKRMAERKHPNGPTRVWDTESWMANSEDRIAGLIASMRATGLTRTAGVLHDAIREVRDVDVRQADGTNKRITTTQAVAPSVAIAAIQKFMGERPFKEVLFKNGLPWVFVFDGVTSPEDGTVVVIGDLGGTYERGLLLFRSVMGFDARKRSTDVRAKLAALAADPPEQARNELINELRAAETLDNASLQFANAEGLFVPHDCYGNPIKPEGDKITVPLNGLGYFLRTNGAPGSFAKLIKAIKESRIEGYEPVDVVAHDLLARVEYQPSLRLKITNILNRPISGKLDVKLGELQLADATQTLSFAAHETKELSLKVTGGQPSAENSYPLKLTFDAGADGRREFTESMHVNLVAKKSINIDGNLEDWKDVLQQPIRTGINAARNLTEKAWLPFVKFDEAIGQGYAFGYLAYDDQNFYFATKIADTSGYDGNVRFANRDDDQYYYPETAYGVQIENGQEKITEFKWPEGVRRFSYRKDPDLPSGAGTDNVQIGFNVLPVEKTDWLSHPPGTMPRFMTYKSTDYEYVLNQVAEKHGGGGEIWRLNAPGMPRKHFYPRQPKVESPGVDGGPVTSGKLSLKRDGNTRIVECAIPWSEIPEVKKKLDAKEPIKFTFRVNDNKGPSYELNEERSVAKADTYSLHNYWQTSWSTETEFAFER